MPVFRTYFKIMKKQLVGLILYGIMFIAITLLITFFIIRDNSKEFTVSRVPILLINNEGDNEFIEAFTSYLEGYVEFIDVDDSDEAGRDALFYNEVKYILTIPKGFTDGSLVGKKLCLSRRLIPI